MRILFIQPPDIHAEAFDVATAKRGRYLNYPPYGLGILASIAEEMGHECRIVNMQTAVLTDVQGGFDIDYDDSWGDELRRLSIEGWAPDVVCITCMFSQTHESFVRVCCFAAFKWPNAQKLVGGVHVTNSLTQEETRQQFLKDTDGYVDGYMLYECDVTFKAYLEDKLLASRQLSNGATEYIGRSPPHDIDRMPAWHLMDPRETSKGGKVGAFYFLRHKDPVVATVLSNRGCRAHCTFCSVRNFNGEGVRRRSVMSVVDELLLLQNEYGVQHIMWLDDDFLFDRHATMALFDQMVRRGVRLTWDCSNGVIAASCTPDMLHGAVDAGCIGLILGMESGNADILHQIKKPGTVRHFVRAAETLRAQPGIHARVFLMIGFPNETLAQIKDTLDVATEMDLDWYNIAPLQALPNTPIYKEAKPTGEFTQIRFNSGPHSRVAQAKDASPWLLDFKHAFDDLERVPDATELDGIWAYMNFHLNYKRLDHETRPVKLAMQQRYVEHICDAIAPDNAFAMHYSMVLSQKRGQGVTEHQRQRLQQRLAESPEWRQRFVDFQLGDIA